MLKQYLQYNIYIYIYIYTNFLDLDYNPDYRCPDPDSGESSPSEGIDTYVCL